MNQYTVFAPSALTLHIPALYTFCFRIILDSDIFYFHIFSQTPKRSIVACIGTRTAGGQQWQFQSHWMFLFGVGYEPHLQNHPGVWILDITKLSVGRSFGGGGQDAKHFSHGDANKTIPGKQWGSADQTVQIWSYRQMWGNTDSEDGLPRFCLVNYNPYLFVFCGRLLHHVAPLFGNCFFPMHRRSKSKIE